MSEIVISKEMIKQLIKDEKIRPEDLFDCDQLKDIRDAARAEGYSEGLWKAGWEKNTEKEEAEKKKTPEGPEKYLDPATNPWIPKAEDK